MNNNSNLLAHRPTGVTILGVLFVIGGVFALLGGIGTLAAVPFAANMIPNAVNNGLELNGSPLTPSQQSALIEASGPVLTALGAILIPLGIASLAVAYGLFKAKRWAWSIAVVLSAILFAINVVSLVTGNMSAITGAVVGMAINAIVLYYLSRRNVRQYFGKATNRIPSTTPGA
jgi:uncharacterized membrane protein (DUF2068 family)